MKSRLYRKLSNISFEIYELNIREGLGGMGGCVCLNAREQTRLDKLRRYYYGHRLYPKFHKLQWERTLRKFGAEIDAMYQSAQSEDAEETARWEESLE